MSRLNWWKGASASCLLCTAAVVTLPAQTFTTLHSFDGTDGDGPEGTLIQATDGNLYGTTAGGGSTEFCSDCGIVFNISPSGVLTTLTSFCIQKDCPDGSSPWAGLIQANGGDFYGTAIAYGKLGNYGVVFKMALSGMRATLHSFGGTDGANPWGGLVQATDGNFYGVTLNGGANGYGTIFKITPTGTLKTLYSFCPQSGCTDGEHPFTALIQAIDGNFYGTSYSGGANGGGTIFRITPAGTLTVIYNFCSQPDCTDGQYPGSALVQATDGSFYGTTTFGGDNNSCPQNGPVIGCGTVFRITPGGALETLYRFCSASDCTDGEYPNAALVQAADGNFYGTTTYGGVNQSCDYNGNTVGCGTVFRISSTGTLTTLYSFCSQSGCTDGQSPTVAALVQDTSGTFCGVTPTGGLHNDGTVFSVSVGLGPFVKTQPASGKVGAAIKILGTNLTGASSVTFHGTAATFTVVSGSEITATVPTGAKTGKVQVVTPGGTLSSNFPFRVAP